MNLNNDSTTDCVFCDLIEDAAYKACLFESQYWKTCLSIQQNYPGRSIIVSKRHVESFSELTQGQFPAAWADGPEAGAWKGGNFMKSLN